ncbi:unnamed protein product [Callosobruchus maculatus]|uniref:2Fe-2S ferredoxin-type domain-containing protein n=1 Tax=Callosobruchus maculatus TaxID=64391 RepID=A0A653C4H5_CALMS|nr:unnamed protein product [Callosobruchus maculatus]
MYNELALSSYNLIWIQSETSTGGRMHVETVQLTSQTGRISWLVLPSPLVRRVKHLLMSLLATLVAYSDYLWYSGKMEKCNVQEKLKSLDKIQFHVSGVEHTVHTNDVTPEMTLNSYLREKSNLTGTKRMCLEGGCGTCIVAVEENVNGKRNVFAVNSVCKIIIYIAN